MALSSAAPVPCTGCNARSQGLPLRTSRAPLRCIQAPCLSRRGGTEQPSRRAQQVLRAAETQPGATVTPSMATWSDDDEDSTMQHDDAQQAAFLNMFDFTIMDALSPGLLAWAPLGCLLAVGEVPSTHITSDVHLHHRVRYLSVRLYRLLVDLPLDGQRSCTCNTRMHARAHTHTHAHVHTCTHAGRMLLWVGGILLDAPWFRNQAIVDTYLAALGVRVVWHNQHLIPQVRGMQATFLYFT